MTPMACFWIPVLMLLSAVGGLLSDWLHHDGNDEASKRWTVQTEKYHDNLLLSRIVDARKRNATCMDGSDAMYYISRHWLSPHWIIHLQAGGSCITIEECRDRAKGPLGSSLLLDERMTGEYVLSDDPLINPTFYSWNKVVIPYCSGDVFVGRQTKRNHPYRIPMLGHYILVAVIEDLIEIYGANSIFTQILLGGTSAGGIGVVANIDHVQKMVYPAKVKGYNDGGWFTMFPNYGENCTEGFASQGLPKFFDVLTELFEKKWDGFVDESCRRQMPKAAACLYGELAAGYISAPLYVMVSRWDYYQMTRMISSEFDMISLPPKSAQELSYVTAFGNNTFRSIYRLLRQDRMGIFSPACYTHTFLTSCVDGLMCGHADGHVYNIEGHTAYTALSEWYNTNGQRGSYVDETDDYPACNPSCCSMLCSQCLPPRTLSKDTIKMADLYSEALQEQDDISVNEDGSSTLPVIYYPGDAFRTRPSSLLHMILFIVIVAHHYL